MCQPLYKDRSMSQSYSSYSGSRSGAMPQQVPLSVYQQVVSDLEAAHMRLAQMSGEYDQLKQQHQQLQSEIQMVTQRLHSLTSAPAPRTTWAPPPAPKAAPETPVRPEAPPDLDFLNHLKRRQTVAPSRTAPPSQPMPPAPEPMDPRTGRSRYGSRFDPMANDLGHLDDLFTDPGTSPHSTGYDTENSAYRRAREQHTHFPMSVLWTGLAIVLVIGSFGAGFMVVQPFVSGSKGDPAPTLPTPSTPTTP
ncbi:MAG: hypothetical protein OHK0012_01380 [Synechococcales cyanobacterium]